MLDDFEYYFCRLRHEPRFELPEHEATAAEMIESVIPTMVGLMAMAVLLPVIVEAVNVPKMKKKKKWEL